MVCLDVSCYRGGSGISRRAKGAPGEVIVVVRQRYGHVALPRCEVCVCVCVCVCACACGGGRGGEEASRCQCCIQAGEKRTLTRR